MSNCCSIESLSPKVSVGDNSAGYIGFRNLDDTDILADDVAVNIVVNNGLTS